MRRSSVVILVVAVLMGGAAAFLARTWIRAHSQAGGGSAGTVVITSAPIGFGSPMTEDKITEIPWGAKTIPEGAFATKQDFLKGGPRVALTAFERGDPVLRSKVSAPGQRGSLSTLLEQGKRAVTVRVDDVRGVAGFILPGDRVDVVLIRTEVGASRQSYSEVILQNIKAIAVDQLASQQPDKATVLAKAVTLEVTPEEAQKVLLAGNIGRLSLMLRQAGEAHSDPSHPITEGDLSGLPPPPPPPPPKIERVVARHVPPPAPPPVPSVVQSDTVKVAIVRGLKREEYTVRKY